MQGDLFWDNVKRKIYATDASAYRAEPLAVAIPKGEKDIEMLIDFAAQHGTSLIPRTAGTSLAGQVVGDGIVVDVSRNFNRILEVNKKESWVRVEPGVIRDDLNKHLAPHGLYFGPETSTANRAMIGGMIGNNSCGSNSVVYGSTREHLLEVKGFLSDGSPVEFKAETDQTFAEKSGANGSMESTIYAHISELLSSEENVSGIHDEFPKASIPRRNTGYALDMLAHCKPFNAEGEPFNFCKLIAGSEGTLMFITEAKLNLLPTPPKDKALICIHCNDVHESLLANLVALQYAPHACELIDHFILDCTKNNIQQQKNRFFIEGEPGAILVVELAANDDESLEKDCQALVKDLENEKLGYAYPVLKGDDISRIWSLRKAGLGLLSNMPGDAKPAPVIEDTAVDVHDLPEYIREFNQILDTYNLSCVHYAHAGSGELHLRPILNLKTKEGHELFRKIAEEIATLVKKYKGSLSGEHGDGRLRGEFIKQMVGPHNYGLLEQVKHTWDPKNIFNPGKIVDTPPMDTSLRYEPGQETPEIRTYFNFDQYGGVLRAAEQCNGSGDCRKSELAGGTMCPSYMATRNEQDTTRARANILREMMSAPGQKNPFDHEEIKEVMDLCLSCKGCKSECPSNVDMARLKAEFEQNYHDTHGLPLTKRLMGLFNLNMRLASIFPWAYNAIFSNALTGNIMKSLLGVAHGRSMPRVANTTLRKWHNRDGHKLGADNPREVYLYCDEFTNYLDAQIGATAVKLLTKLGYRVAIPKHDESCRALISKGMLKNAIPKVNDNIRRLSKVVSKETPLIGIEPSTILTLRDEYPDLCDAELQDDARRLADGCLTIEEFLQQEFQAGHISQDQFSESRVAIKAHGHCHQKALSSINSLKAVLSIPKNYQVEMIPSGCCGMAGSFGYEKDHFELSMKIGGLVLFPAIEGSDDTTVIVAPGTSCRHQILDGTGKRALHPVEVLFDALI